MAKMETISVNAYAKVNFTLDILGRTGGYHRLDSLVCTVGLSDSVTAVRRADGRCFVAIEGLDAEALPRANKPVRAAEAFFYAFGGGGAEIRIVRSVPVGAGLGSSSADAAGVLKALALLYGIADMGAVKRIADTLGSDTGYLLTGGWARMTGRGEQIEPLADMPPLWLLLVLPHTGMDTAACFAEYDRRGESFSPCTQESIDRLRAGRLSPKCFSNALTQAACARNADIARALETVHAVSAYGGGMTGSGSACYAVFAEEAACLAARASCPKDMTALCVPTVPQK